MQPILFTINGVNFYSYGFFVALAFLVCYGVMYYLAQKNKLNTNYLFEKLLIVLVSGIVGARILYFILYYNQFTSLWEIFKIWQGGMVSFGGILGGFVALIIIFRKDLLRYLDTFGVAFLLAAATWRIGCFLAGDHPGIFSSAWYAINYEVPAILFEIIFSLAGFAIAYLLYNKKVFRNGIIFFGVFGWYGASRMVVDYFRLDPTYMGLKTGQWAGIIMLIIAITGILSIKIYQHKKRIKNA